MNEQYYSAVKQNFLYSYGYKFNTTSIGLMGDFRN